MEKTMAKNKKNLPQKPGEIVTGKWFTKKKIIAASVVGVVLVAAVILAVVLAFNWIRPIESSEEEARVVGTVGDFEVRYEELRYITLLHKASLDAEIGKYDELLVCGEIVPDNYYGRNEDPNVPKYKINAELILPMTSIYQLMMMVVKGGGQPIREEHKPSIVSKRGKLDVDEDATDDDDSPFVDDDSDDGELPF